MKGKFDFIATHTENSLTLNIENIIIFNDVDFIWELLFTDKILQYPSHTLILN